MGFSERATLMDLVDACTPDQRRDAGNKGCETGKYMSCGRHGRSCSALLCPLPSRRRIQSHSTPLSSAPAPSIGAENGTIEDILRPLSYFCIEGAQGNTMPWKGKKR